MTGLRCYNDSGTIQFDSDMPNYGFVAKVTCQTTDLSDISIQSHWSFAYVQNLPAFDSYAASCSTSAVTGGVIGFNDAHEVYITAGGGSHTVTIYLFKLFNKYQPVSGAGLELFDAYGRLSYSTAYRPLAAVARVPVAAMQEGMSAGYALPAGRTHAFMQYGTMKRQYRSNQSGGGDIGGSPFNAAAVGVRLGSGAFWIEEIVGNSVCDGTYVNGGIVVADVTGL